MMNLKRFNTETVTAVRVIGGNLINFNAKTGVVSLTAGIVRAMGITPDEPTNRLEFIQDSDKLTDWYVAIGPKGFPVKFHSKASAQVSARAVVREIFESLTLAEHNVVQFVVDDRPVEQEGMKLYALLTRLPKIKKPL